MLRGDEEAPDAVGELASAEPDRRRRARHFVDEHHVPLHGWTLAVPLGMRGTASWARTVCGCGAHNAQVCAGTARRVRPRWSGREEVTAQPLLSLVTVTCCPQGSRPAIFARSEPSPGPSGMPQGQRRRPGLTESASVTQVAERPSCKRESSAALSWPSINVRVEFGMHPASWRPSPLGS